MSEHGQLLMALDRIAVVLERIEAKIGAPTPEVGRQVVSLSEAAKRLGTRYETARQLVESGQLEAWRENDRWHVPQAAIADYISTRRAVA